MISLTSVEFNRDYSVPNVSMTGEIETLPANQIKIKDGQPITARLY